MSRRGIKDMSFAIEPAKAKDWQWITKGEVEIVWFRLGEQQQEVDRIALTRHVEQYVAQLREDEGFPNVAFVAYLSDGTPAGFIWVARTHNDFTGQLEAVLLNQYVDEPYRGQGLGQRLMDTAETWARQQGLQHISLSVGVHNHLGQKLYESLGYRVDTLRMTKTLDPRVPDDTLITSDY